MTRPDPSASTPEPRGARPYFIPDTGAGTDVRLAPCPDLVLERLCSLVADYFESNSAVILEYSADDVVLLASHGVEYRSPKVFGRPRAHKTLDAFGLSNMSAHPSVMTGSTLYDMNGEPVGWLGIELEPKNLSARTKELLNKFARLAESSLHRRPNKSAEVVSEYCPLTGLLNRATGLEHLDAALAEARNSGAEVALVIADIADFNAINSAFGRSTGDAILRAAAQRLAQLTPETTMVFRLSGDQFALVMTLMERGDEIDNLISSIATGFVQPVRAEEREVILHFVFGTAFYPHRAGSTPELLDRAILALRRAQERRTGAEVFTTELEERLIREVSVEQRLRSALAHKNLSVAYQPKICLRTGNIFSVEALARWIDSELGFVSPGEFIPAAERAGLIVDLGRQVLETALRDVLRLRAIYPDLTVSVNVAAAQLQRDEFVDEVTEALRESGAPSAALELEVVETSLIENIGRARAIVNRLRSHGVTFSIDDFGTGYSSLAYLRQLPVQTLKIDREFVGVITNTPRDAALVQSIISMAHVLNFRVVAEGVETEEQATLLREFTCDAGQGYLWAKPSPIDVVIQTIQQKDT